jgi:hypothetical protein
MRTNKDEREFPILLAYERNHEGHLSVWCPYCICFHHHGTGEGHRVAHCSNPDSPYKNGGYVIKKPGAKEKQFLKEIQQYR